ncbi:terminase small subunit [Ralstonia phage UAM5]|nr:terminase small subunit [Ralstonia phage UAM5]
MTFNRDVNCYRAAPRSLQTSKFGCYAEMPTYSRRRRSTMLCYATALVLIAIAGLVAFSR